MKLRTSKNILRILIVSFISCLIIAQPVVLNAGLGNDMQRFFEEIGFRSTANTPGFYQGQRSGMLTGGSHTLRARHLYNPPIWSISPPQIKAGCGGIDLFWGAFQFVNAEQLTNMLKGIGAAAIGYAFKLGLEAVCPTCNQTLSELANFANQLAALGQDSCAIAQLVVDKIVGDQAGAQKGKEDCKARKRAEGKNEAEAEQDCSSNWVLEMIKEARTSLGMDKIDKLPLGKVPGSVVDRALKRLNLTDEQIIVIRSFTGDILITVDPNKAEGDEKSIPTPKFYQPKITLTQLMYGDPNAEFLVYYDSTFTIKEEKRGYLNIGMKQKIYNQLKSISTKILSGTTLTDDEKNLIDGTPFPIIPLIENVSKIPGATDSYISLISDLIAVSYAYNLVSYYINIVLSNVNNASAVVPVKEAVEFFTKAKEQLRTELIKESQVLKELYTALSLTMFYIKEVNSKISTALNVSTQRR